MVIQELHNYTQSQFEELKQLISELSDRVTLTQMDLMMVLKDSNSHLYVIMDNLTPSPSPNGEGSKIIGCATLCVFHSPTGTKASIEDVVVSSAYRGQHLGKQLMEYIIEQAKAFAPMDSTLPFDKLMINSLAQDRRSSPGLELHLTSNPKRVVANNLYQSLGFQKKETNCYQMNLSGDKTVSYDNNSLKQSITYIIGKERAEGNMDPISPIYISRILNVPVEDVESCMKEMNV